MDPLTTELALNISKAIRDDAFSLIFQKSDRDYDGFVTLKEYYQSCAKIIDRAWIEPEKEKREYRRFLAWFSLKAFQSYRYNSYHMKTLLSFENLEILSLIESSITTILSTFFVEARWPTRVL